MSDGNRFDEQRSAAWRRTIVETARTDGSRRGTRGRVSIVVGLVVAALVVSGGGVAYALSVGVLKAATVETNSPTPLQRDTPGVIVPPTPTSSPSAGATGRDDAVEACTLLKQMFTVSGTSEQDTKATAQSLGARVVDAAQMAQSADAQWSGTAQAVINAQRALIAYLEDNTPTGITTLEKAADEAHAQCSEVGVDVVLQQ